MNSDFAKRVETAVTSLETGGRQPKIGIVLGSGLGGVFDIVRGKKIPYSSIEGFPVPTVEGHEGALKIASDVAVMAGRFHLYEGYDVDDVVLPVFLMYRLGVRQLVLTNAAGAVNPSYQPGELVLIRDHLNLLGSNPLIGPNPEKYGPRFPDMTRVYSRRLIDTVQDGRSLPLKEGVYAALSGPSYETPAEISMLRTIGADMVGMSTVPEAIAAKYLGLEVLGISCITNFAAGIAAESLNHEEVVKTGKSAAAELIRLIVDLLDKLGHTLS